MRYSHGVPISPPIAAAILWVVWGVSWIIAAGFASAAKVRTPRATLATFGCWPWAAPSFCSCRRGR